MGFDFSEFISAKKVVKFICNNETKEVSEIAKIIFAKYEDEWKKYAKAKETKMGVSLWVGFSFLKKKIEEIYEAKQKEETTRLNSEDLKKVVKAGEEIKKKKIKERIKKQQEKENDK